MKTKEPPEGGSRKGEGVVAGNQGFKALGGHGARPTRGQDESPYRSPCNSHVRDTPGIFKLRVDIPVS